MDAVHAFHDAFFDRVFLAAADEVDDDFTIHGRLEGSAAAVEFFAKGAGIGQVAVMSQSQLSHGRIDSQRWILRGLLEPVVE